ncbi:hypothetical protein CQ018_02365 [Arthrobacter sp. MYb227]|uniref:hypothetical protein n=1 Tax=Arthrobacter sp. MYb227 TaxID=1848601 RepID=UPI000CFC751F|nr:hypothetical protein [Arthrobacter sp. MYb227]PQZ96146.1 hypothetical protein CQ018_02365 [Arthrobacter sp. MYb227]
MTGAATTIGIGLAISAALLYMLLRFVVATPKSANVIEAVSQHAFWTALIAFFASGTSGLANLWANPDPQASAPADVTAMIMHAASPGLWLGVVYVLGQFTWPRHLQPVRQASLEVRSVKDAIPRALAAVLLGCVALSTVAVIAAWNDPGAPSRARVDQADLSAPWDGSRDEYGNPIDEWGYVMSQDEVDAAENWTPPEELEPAAEITGTKPGSEVGPWMLGGLALVVVACASAATIIIRRPPLQSLDEEDNKILRATWINRLLRTGTFVVAGFGAASLAYVAEGIRARSEWEHSTPETGFAISREAESLANLLTGSSTLFMLLLVIALLAWKPPRLTNVASRYRLSAAYPSIGYIRARDFLLLTQGVGLVFVAVLFSIFGLLGTRNTFSMSSAVEVSPDSGPLPSDESPWMTRLDAAARLDELSLYLGLLACAAVAYLLVQLLATFIIQRRLGSTTPLAEPRTALLPAWFVVLICGALATVFTAGTNFVIYAAEQNRIAILWVGATILITAVLAVLLYRCAARRPVLKGASAREDLEIRVLVAHRGARLLAGVSLIAAGLLANEDFMALEISRSEGGQNGFQITCMVLGIAMCFLPASTTYSRRAAKTRPSVSSDA